MLLILIGVPKLFPPSVLSRRYISLFPVLFSCHTTSVRLAIDSIWGNCESPVLLLRLIGVPKLFPLFVLSRRYISLFPVLLSCHTTSVRLAIDSIWGNCESPGLVTEIFLAPGFVPAVHQNGCIFRFFPLPYYLAIQQASG